jgi:putative ABC transport system permease protein
MLTNYIKVAIRNLRRYKFFSLINISGLAISMSICMGIMMLVADQVFYDQHNSKGDRVFRVFSRPVGNDGLERGGMDNSTSPLTLKDELLTNYTGVEKAVRIKRGFGNNWMEMEEQDVNIPLKGFFADPEVFDVFEYEMQYGDPKTALVEPYSVVLTRAAANKLFKEENPVGQTIKVGEIGTYMVTGVLKETKNKSHIVFEGLASMATVKSLEASGKAEELLDNWTNFWNGWTYIVIEDGKSPKDIQAHLDNIFKKHIASIENPETFKAKFLLQNLNEITPGKFMNNPIGPFLPWMFIYFLGGLALIVLLTSCFNFTNLSIARSLTRAREIGVRKVTGAARWQIFSQFLTESVVIAIFSLVLGLGLLAIVKPLMMQMTFARIFMWDLQANYVVYIIFAVFAIVVGVIAGFFPAAVLSGFQPVKVLKSLNSMKLFSRLGLRKALLVIQFTLSLVFILTVIITYNQLDLFLGKDHGFEMQNNLVVRLNNTSAEVLKSELSKYNNVVNVAAASHIPASGMSYGNGFKKKIEDKDWTSLGYFAADENYLENIGVKLVAGRNFSVGLGDGNKNFMLINESAVKAFHFDTPLDAIGEELISNADSVKRTIIGVIKDYNHQMLVEKIEPMALMYTPSEFNILQVKYTGSFENASKSVERAWANVNPAFKLDYKDMDAEIKKNYDAIFGDLVDVLTVVAFLAVIISCLGLLGMATYTTETRIKEISIRKVLGSSDQALVFLLSKGFLKLLSVSILIGVPIAYFGNNLWLEFMAYRTEIDFTVIATGVLTMLALGAITIGSQTLKAAFTNPVDNLKNE